MSNLRVIDADPSEPPSHEEVIRLANSLLGEFNIPATIKDIRDICAALFVLLYENLFSDRLSGVIRQPVTKEDEIHNCQTVIDVLSSEVVRDSLSHIRGVDIVNGDITAISNLLDIFSYLLEYVANGIESDFGTDNEDARSLTVTEQGSEVNLRVKEMKSNKQMSPVHSLGKKSISSRRGKETSADCRGRLARPTGRTSPGMNTNENKSSERYCAQNPFSDDGGNFKVSAEDLQMPPSPIRPDQSQSLLGQKTIDSTELEQEYGKEYSRSLRQSPPLKAAFEEEPGLNTRYEEPNEHPVPTATTDAVIGGTAASATTSPALYPMAQASLHGNGCNGSPHYIFTHHLYHHYDWLPPPHPPPPFSSQTAADLEPEGVMPRSYKTPYLSSPSASLPKQSMEEDKKYGLHSSGGQTDDLISNHTAGGNVEAESRWQEPCPGKGLSSSYHELRNLVERTAAMTRHALQTSPVLGRVQPVVIATDSTDNPRPSIPSDGVRLAKELNARGMVRGELCVSPSRSAKRVAFTSQTHGGGSSTSLRNRQPLEELSDNDDTTAPKGSHSRGEGRQRSPGYDHDLELDYRFRLAGPTIPEKGDRPRKAESKTEAFAKHLAQSRQPELGAAHLNLKTEDRALKKKQEFLQRLYEEDFEEFSEDVKSLLVKDQRTSKNTEKQMLKSYKESKPLVGGRKIKTPSKAVSSKKPKMAARVVSSKVKQQTGTGQSISTASTSPVKLESEEDLLPLLLNEFPHLHLSDHTWHEMCRKGLHQIEAITRVYRENQLAKGRAQNQLKEAAQRHELLSDIMRKELEATKRMRELKEQKAQQIQTKNKTQEKRIQSSRARRYYNEYQVRARSKQLKRRTKEEMVFRDLFKDAMKIQKERIRDIRQYSTDQRKCLENRRKNEMESLENFYQDQFQMLGEKLTKERRENNLRDKAQHQMVEQVKRELRKKIESEITLYQDQMFRDDDDAHFRGIDADRVKRQLHMARYAAHI